MKNSLANFKNTAEYESAVIALLNENNNIITSLMKIGNVIGEKNNGMVRFEYTTQPLDAEILNEHQAQIEEKKIYPNISVFLTIFLYKKTMVWVFNNKILNIPLIYVWLNNVNYLIQKINDTEKLFIKELNKDKNVLIRKVRLQNTNTKNDQHIVMGEKRHQKWMERVKSARKKIMAKERQSEIFQNTINESAEKKTLINFLKENYGNNPEFIRKHYPKEYKIIFPKN